MIQSAKEIFHPTARASALDIRLHPENGELPENFRSRIEALRFGLHRIEFTKVSDTEYLVLVVLNPSWPEVVEEDFKAIDKLELLKELDAVTAVRVSNKIDY